MFVDASALTAIMMAEEDSDQLFEKIEGAARCITSPLAVWEAGVAVARIAGLPLRRAYEKVSDYLEVSEIELVGIPPEAAALALAAFDRYGKGRHPARLNMGDCFAYACARHFGQKLLYKGEDFALTDIETA